MNLNILLEKQFLTLEEIGELEESPEIERIEINGFSGLYNGYLWYTCYRVDKTEIDIYTKKHN